MNEDNVAIRLKGFIDYLGISSSQFADQCGIPRPTLSQLLNGRNKKISDVVVGQIHATFPQLSVLWLLFGEGEMLEKPSEGLSDEESNESGGIGNSAVSEERGGSQSPSGASGGPNMRLGPPGIGSESLEKAIAERDSTIEELQREIERLKRNPRKVAQITVYYDDSTFETFYPGAGMAKGR